MRGPCHNSVTAAWQVRSQRERRQSLAASMPQAAPAMRVDTRLKCPVCCGPRLFSPAGLRDHTRAKHDAAAQRQVDLLLAGGPPQQRSSSAVPVHAHAQASSAGPTATAAASAGAAHGMCMGAGAASLSGQPPAQPVKHELIDLTTVKPVVVSPTVKPEVVDLTTPAFVAGAPIPGAAAGAFAQPPPLPQPQVALQTACARVLFPAEGASILPP